MEKPLETAWVGLKFGWHGVSGNHQGRAKNTQWQYEPGWWRLRCDTQLLALGEGVGSAKAQWPVPALLSGRNLRLQFSFWCQTVQFILVCLWCLSSCCPNDGPWASWSPPSHLVAIPAVFYQFFIYHTLVWNQPILLLCPSYQSPCGFFKSLVIGLPVRFQAVLGDGYSVI